jgi:hypothetical protein
VVRVAVQRATDADHDELRQLGDALLTGWREMMGREPMPNDLIVPMPASRRVPLGGMRTKNDSYKRLEEGF